MNQFCQIAVLNEETKFSTNRPLSDMWITIFLGENSKFQVSYFCNYRQSMLLLRRRPQHIASLKKKYREHLSLFSIIFSCQSGCIMWDTKARTVFPSFSLSLSLHALHSLGGNNRRAAATTKTRLHILLVFPKFHLQLLGPDDEKYLAHVPLFQPISNLQYTEEWLDILESIPRPQHSRCKGGTEKEEEEEAH